VRLTTPPLGAALSRRIAPDGSAPAAIQERVAQMLPLTRLGTAEDVAQTAGWLLSDTAAFVNGATISTVASSPARPRRSSRLPWLQAGPLAGERGELAGMPLSGQACLWSSSTEGTTIGPSGGCVNRIGLPNGSRSAQSVP
jgi:enoyl-ACP reductase-like protein